MHFTSAKSSPKILLLLKHKNCLVRSDDSLLMQCIITEKQSNQINNLLFVQIQPRN